MGEHPQQPEPLPSAEQIRQAVGCFLGFAYGPDVPPGVRKLLPPEQFEPAEWLMTGPAERDPADAPAGAVRSFVLRLGNTQYPHMKLRISRPPRDNVFLFSVDSHDAFLRAPAGSSDFLALEALKAHNARLASQITAAWDAHGLPTERNYLRQKIEQARTAAACPLPPQAEGPARGM
jgi:hypothetical protein